MSSQGGVFDRLLWNGLRPDEYRLLEKGVGGSLEPKDKETVLLFQLDRDHDRFDELRHNEPSGTKICDGLFFYQRRKQAPWLLFFELKSGQDFEHAVSQLKSGVQLLLKNLHPNCDPLHIHAVVVHGGAAPVDLQSRQKEFREQLRVSKAKVTLGFVPCPPKEVVELREELETRIRLGP